MERIVIIDHDAHILFVEDIDEKMLEKKYNGEEEKYIKDNYEISDNFSWDFIVSAQYIPTENDDKFYEIDFSSLVD